MYRFHKIKLYTNFKVEYCVCKKFSSTPQENVGKMKLFWDKEILHASNLRYDLLDGEEKIIHNLHDDAIKKGYFTYRDPKTNERILTRLRHFLRGKCCGNACRHCVYDHNNVIDEYKLKVRKFNSSFWTYPDEIREIEFDESCYFDGTNLKVRNRPVPTTSFGFNKL